MTWTLGVCSMCRKIKWACNCHSFVYQMPYDGECILSFLRIEIAHFYINFCLRRQIIHIHIHICRSTWAIYLSDPFSLQSFEIFFSIVYLGNDAPFFFCRTDGDLCTHITSQWKKTTTNNHHHHHHNKNTIQPTKPNNTKHNYKIITTINKCILFVYERACRWTAAKTFIVIKTESTFI